jgi:bacillithiol system protein YtxJ
MANHPNWILLTTKEQLQQSLQHSHDRVQVYFKHSTRCIISKMVLKNFEEQWSDLPDNVDLLFIDLLQFRELSNSLAEQLHVKHESPQVIVVRDGKTVYHASHDSIHTQDVAQHCV